jgi:predicted  nucleic acid-binding Zn-ribbon protein
MNQQRAARLTPKPRPATAKRASTAASWWLIITALCFCAGAGLLFEWGSRMDAVATAATTPPNAPAATLPDAAALQTTTDSADLSQEVTTAYTNLPVQGGTAPDGQVTSYNPDPAGTLMLVLAQEGEGIALVGGAVVGGILLLIFAARHVTRIPKDPLATGLGRTLTLLENNHRAGNLTPLRAMEVARQAVGEMEAEHAATIRDRTQEYEQAVVRLAKTHADAIATIREEATQAVKRAQAETSQANMRAEGALQRTANTEAQVQQLSRDLAATHQQLVEAHARVRQQTTEITELNQALSAATDTLIEWQAAHTEMSDRYVALTVQHQEIKQTLASAQSEVARATKQAEKMAAEAQALRTQQAARDGEKTTLSAQLAVANKELSRLRGVSLRELPFMIADREDELLPHMAEIVGFIRGMTVDSGAAGGERATKPILTSWREIRRLLQTLKTKGVRLAVTTHHVPQWARALVEGEGTAEGKAEGENQATSSNVQALTKTAVPAHNGGSTDSTTSEAGVSTLQHA